MFSFEVLSCDFLGRMKHSLGVMVGQYSTLTQHGRMMIIKCTGHSMLLDSRLQKLFVFAGQHERHYLSDMWEYNLVTRSLEELCADFSAGGGPDACFAQRAAIDMALQEIYM